ncbi:hypothetical protein AB3N60_15435 [Leptospira sp. WS39.C2]
MKKIYFLILLFCLHCKNPFDLNVIRKADGPDYILAEIDCNRSGLRIPVIEELVLADIFGGIGSIREAAKNHSSKIVLSSSYEGSLDFHLAYNLEENETYIFRNTIPVGLAYCIPKEKTFFYKLALYRNRLILWFNQYSQNDTYLYLGEGSFQEAELYCLKFSKNKKRKILPEVLLADFTRSNVYKYLNLIGKSSFWLSRGNYEYVYSDKNNGIQVESNDKEKKSIICAK